MHALTGKRIQVRRQGCDERLALTGLHLRDAALVQDDAANDLHRKRFHAQHAPGSLAAGGKSLGQQVVQRFAVFQALFEFRRLRLEFLIRQFGIFLFKGKHLFLQRKNPLDFLFRIVAKQFFNKTHFVHLILTSNRTCSYRMQYLELLYHTYR